MPFTPDPPFPKTQGDNIRSKDWNDVVNEIIRLDNAKTNRAGDHFTGPLTIDGNVGIGAAASTARLDVTATTWNSHLRLINSSDAGAGPGLYFKSAQRDWAILATHGGASAGPQKLGFYDATANAYRMVIDPTGNVGIGVTAPVEDLHVATRIRAQSLTMGAWAANANYQMVGTANLDQAQSGNYALLQSGAGGDIGETYLNSPTRVHLRLGNIDQAVLEANGMLTVGASNNPLRFSSGWTGFPDAATNRAEISNDVTTQKTLMIVGNKSAGLGRRVSVWDRLEVNGDLLVTGRIGSFNKPATPLTPGWGGGLRTWDIEAEGTIWSRNNVQTGSRDLAEIYFSDLDLQPGDVVSLDPEADCVVRAAGPNDTSVIGIVSTEPGVLLNSQLNVEAKSDGKRGFPIALCGRVPCKVSDENGPIRRGDLLTSASKPGFAMRAQSVEIEGKSVFAGGTLIGKALAAHARGEGEIEVFVILR